MRSRLSLSVAALVLPLLTIHLCWLVSSLEGYIDWCVPYTGPCTSISRAGRYGTAWWLFKLLMIPASVLMIHYWWACRRWLHACTGKWRDSLLWLGAGAGVALLVYTLALGAGPGLYTVLRRAGVILFFAFSFLALLRVAVALREQPRWRLSGQRLLYYSLMLLGIGIGSVLHDVIDPVGHEQWEDVYEWWLALLLLSQAVWVLLIQWRSGWPHARVGAEH